MKATTHAEPLRLGFAVPMFAAPGIATMRTPSVERLDWAQVLDAIRSAEALGYDSAWFSDHLFHGLDGEFLESWTTLAASASATQRIRLVNNHLGLGFRSAPLVAKMSATADVISSGRFELFASHGLRAREHTSYGFDWEPDSTVRLARLDEAITVIRALWTGQPITHSGESFKLDEALSTPVPSHEIPVWIGGPLDDTVVSLIVGRADGWNSLPATLDEYASKVERIDAACRAARRDPARFGEVSKPRCSCLISEHGGRIGWRTGGSFARVYPLGFATSDMFPPGSELSDEQITETCFNTFIVGTRSEVAKRFAAYRELGVSEFVCWFMDWPVGESMRILAEDIRPTL